VDILFNLRNSGQLAVKHTNHQDIAGIHFTAFTEHYASVISKPSVIEALL
jgi:hypothetical protein